MWRRWEVEKGILRFIFIFSANAFDDHWSNTRSLSSALALSLSHSVCVCERVFSLPHSTFSLYRSFRHLNVWLIVVSVASTLPQRWATDKPSYFFFSLSLSPHTHTYIQFTPILYILALCVWALFLLYCCGCVYIALQWVHLFVSFCYIFSLPSLNLMFLSHLNLTPFKMKASICCHRYLFIESATE